MQTSRLILLACIFPIPGLVRAETAPDPQHHAALRDRLAALDAAYHDPFALPSTSDADYDALARELADAEPTGEARLAAVAVPGERAPHEAPMGSLAKLADAHAAVAWAHACERAWNRHPLEFLVQPKYDGVALSAVYEHGALVRILTRGDGISGVIVTDSVLRACRDIPAHLDSDAPAIIEIRGELFVNWQDFVDENARRSRDGSRSLAHPRGLAAGIVQALPECGAPGPRARFVAFAAGAVSNGPFARQTEMIDRFRQWGFHVPPTIVVHGPEAVGRTVTKLMLELADWPFPADGVVIKVDDSRRADAAESPSNAHMPGAAAAVKNHPHAVPSRLTDISLQISHSGIITPVAEFEPVEINGRSIRRASLHNPGFLERAGFQPGDPVCVELRGDTIPAVAPLLPSALERPPLDLQSLLVRHGFDPARVERVDGRWLYTDSNHPDWRHARLTHFVSPLAMNIRNVGPAMVKRLLESGLVTDGTGLYRLTVEQLTAAGGMEEAEARRLLDAIAESRGQPLWRYLYASGVRDVGPAFLRRIGDHFGSSAALERAQWSDLEAVAALGERPRKRFWKWLEQEGGRRLVAFAAREGICSGDH